MPYPIDVDNAAEPTDLREIGLSAAELRAIKAKLLAFVRDINGNPTFNAGQLFLDYTTGFTGINNLAPTTQLDVIGSIKASGSLLLDGLTYSPADSLTFADSIAAYFGTDQDFGIANDGSATILQSFTSGQIISILGKTSLGDTELALVIDPDNATRLYGQGILVASASADRLTVHQELELLEGVLSDITLNGVSPRVEFNNRAALFLNDTTKTATLQAYDAGGIAIPNQNINLPQAGNPTFGLQQLFHEAYHPNADTLTTPRLIELVGDVTGSVLFDGSGNVQITAIVGDGTHNHTAADITDFTAASLAIIGSTVTGNTESGIAVTFDGTKLNFDVNDFTITLGGDLTGSVAINNLTSAVLTAEVVNDSHTHDTQYYPQASADSMFLRKDISDSITASWLRFNDSKELRFGDSGDIRLFWDSLDFYITSAAGTEFLKSPAGNSVELYHGGFKKLETTAGGISVTGAITASGDITANSDVRLKTDVTTIPNAVETTKRLRGVNFTRISDKTRGLGVIADELQNVLPELVSIGDTPEAIKSVAYGNLTGLLIEAVKELSARVEALEAGGA